MWNLFKRKKKEGNIVSFPFYLLFSHRLVLYKLMEEDEIPYEKALAHVLGRGFDECAHELLDREPSPHRLPAENATQALTPITTEPTAHEEGGEERLFKMEPVPDQREHRPVQFVKQVQRRHNLRPGHIRYNDKPRKGRKYFYMHADDSAKFAKAGYRFYKLTKTEKGDVYLMLFRSQEKDTHAISCSVMYEGTVLSMRFHEKKKYSPMVALRNALRIEEEVVDIRFVVRDGQGCLLLQLFYDKDIIKQPTNN